MFQLLADNMGQVFSIVLALDLVSSFWLQVSGFYVGFIRFTYIVP